MSMAFILLAAGWAMEDVLKIVVMVVFGLIYLFNHLLGGGKAQKRRPARPAEPRPAGRPEVKDEVAEFLKRATEKRSPPKPVQARPQAPRRPIPAENVEDRLEPSSASRWPQTVEPHVDNRDLADRASQLSHMNQTEAALQAHMQTFEHSVGRIHEAAADTAPSPETAADGRNASPPATPGEIFAALLADPQSLRQAIILNEIIQRPEERW
jgi:hypothetical protein